MRRYMKIPLYDPKKIETKWQREWARKKIYKTAPRSQKPKFYVLDMFPYPSGEGLHVGHPKGYIASDVVSRMKRMQGFNVLHPMGFDAFGLPAENYAIQTKTNPAKGVAQNVKRYKKQLEILGFDYDWSREINTTDPKYYKWTQWIFLKLLEKGLAYEALEPINWCPVDKTGLANEDVEDGKCERCGSPVEKKLMRQWMLKITAYSDRLLNDLDLKDENGRALLDWPASIKEAQKNWIKNLHDWVFSRQRYWGEPIPVLHSTDPSDPEKIIPLSEKDLPLTLPKVKYYEPTDTGESPLANISKWVNVTMGKGKNKKTYRRETNTMPQWAGSSWYYLRYMDPKNSKKLVDPQEEKYWNIVDLYVGGAEHATRHLIYARFWHKFLYDIGVVSTKEPFRRLQSVGLILAEDGRKMSKRWKNTINPDEIVERFGADTLRLYEMFMGPFDQAISWNTDSMVGTRRFIERVWKAQEKVQKGSADQNKELEISFNKTIKKVTEDIDHFRFNTAISSLMILLNEIEKHEKIEKNKYEIFLKLLAPFAPHVAEELWNRLGNKKTIHLEVWPLYNETSIEFGQMTIAIQINGKTRGTVEVGSNDGQEEIEKKAREASDIQRHLRGRKIKRVIYVKGRILNLLIDED
jgi:leucyl-tRNA synthetase